MQKETWSKLFGVCMVLIIVGLLIFAGPAQAFSLSVSVSDTMPNIGDSISFIATLNISSGERLPIDYLNLDISGPVNTHCIFDVGGMAIFGCEGININPVSSSNYTSGNLTGEFNGSDYDWGYGYGYEGLPSEISYNITLNTTGWNYGVYETEFSALVDSDEFSEAGENILIVKPVEIVDENITACLIESENFTVSANITGSIENVYLALNTDGSWRNVSLSGTSEGIYSYEISSFELSGSSTVYWKFFVEDIAGSITEGVEQNAYINSMTRLTVLPSIPNGLNEWYTSEPTFILTNPDGNISYWWNGSNYDYTGPFDLDGTPNNGNLTGGEIVLRYNSDVCSESEKEWNGHFDFTNPLIKDFVPADNSVVYNEFRPTISAYLDEIYQSNSGIDVSSIVMTVNGEPVAWNMTPFGELDFLVSYVPEEDLTDGIYTAEIFAMDNSGRNSSESWSFEIDVVEEFDMIVYSPEDGLYDGRRVPFNISTTLEVLMLEFINYADNNPRWQTICRNCDSYGFDRARTKSLKEGLNDLTVRATGEFDVEREQDISVFVDSKAPRIKKTTPDRGFADGTFGVEFDELNPNTLMLVYGNESVERTQEVNLSECVGDKTKVCSTDVDLTDFDGSAINYYFALVDIVGNSVQSLEKSLDVDFSAPVINFVNHSVGGRNVNFLIDVSESNLDRIVYIENGRENNLCRQLDEGVCEARKSFRDGEHNLTIVARDKSDKEDSEFVNFSVDSKAPRISKTEPRRNSVINGSEFSVKYTEDNLESVVLFYGDKNVTLEDCLAGSNQVCSVSVDLGEFDGEWIEYYFEVGDSLNFVDSGLTRIFVDTTSPILVVDSPKSRNYGVKVPFNMTVSEEVDLQYYDNSVSNPRWSNLCTNCNEYGSVRERTKRFSVGAHEILIRAVDEAGNVDFEEVGFVVE